MRDTDTPHGLEPGGFSVQRRRHPRDCLKALSAPEHGAGRVLVAVQAAGAVGTDVGAHTEAFFWMRSPQPLQSCAVYAGVTASTCLPAHAGVQARMDRKWCHPASCMLLLRPALRLAPVWS